MPSYELRKSQRWDDLPVGEINLICMLPTIVLKVERGKWDEKGDKVVSHLIVKLLSCNWLAVHFTEYQF